MAAEMHMNEQTDLSAPGNDAHERALLHRVVARERDALTELYRIYHARLFKFTFRLTRSYSEADELVNDILLAVWQDAASFRGHSRVSTWLFGIAYRKAMRRLGRKGIKLVSCSRLEEVPADDMAVAETEDWVRRGLDALPAAQQLTVMLVFYLGLSYPEVSEVTDCPVNTVKSRMFHARRKLRDFLTESAGAQAPAGGSRDERDLR
jgi:RNA polymerase sigma-70 factor, ECF subfamily